MISGKYLVVRFVWGDRMCFCLWPRLGTWCLGLQPCLTPCQARGAMPGVLKYQWGYPWIAPNQSKSSICLADCFHQPSINGVTPIYGEPHDFDNLWHLVLVSGVPLVRNLVMASHEGNRKPPRTSLVRASGHHQWEEMSSTCPKKGKVQS